jgi:hypothetical protein
MLAPSGHSCRDRVSSDRSTARPLRVAGDPSGIARPPERATKSKGHGRGTHGSRAVTCSARHVTRGSHGRRLSFSHEGTSPRLRESGSAAYPAARTGTSETT